MLLKIMNAARALQVCAGQDESAEATIDAMNDLSEDNAIKAVLLIDAEDVREVILHNLYFISPIT